MAPGLDVRHGEGMTEFSALARFIEHAAEYKTYLSDPQADRQSEEWAKAMDDCQELLRQLNAT